MTGENSGNWVVSLSFVVCISKCGEWVKSIQTGFVVVYRFA